MPVQLSSVIIGEEKIEQIKSAISQLQNHELIFTTWGFSEVFEKGTAVSLLFYGIPGTGKTLMAQAIADHLGQELKVIGTADIETSEPGGAERAIRKVFQDALQPNPATGRRYIICFDECDSLLMDRNAVGSILAGQVNALLSEIEKFTGVVVFTTNRLGKLDPALERRITAKIEFTFPNEAQRALIWRRMIPQRCPIAHDVVIEELAKAPIAGGNIKNAVLNAARMAAYRHATEIAREHFLQAVNDEMKALSEFLNENMETHSEFTRKSVSEPDMTRDIGGVTISRKKVASRHGEKVLVDVKDEIDKIMKTERKTDVKA
jgi:AAA+ superfamily predicted ATPase